MQRCSGVKNQIIFLIGNKADLESSRQVTEGEGLVKAAKLGAKFFEINAFDSVVIDSVFGCLAEAVHGQLMEQRSFDVSPALSQSNSLKSSPTIRLSRVSPLKYDKNGNEQKNKKSCCIVS